MYRLEFSQGLYFIDFASLWIHILNSQLLAIVPYIFIDSKLLLMAADS